jgi:hypothetical protein
MAYFETSQYGSFVELQNVSGSGDPTSAPDGGVYIFASGSSADPAAAKLYFQNKGGDVTDITKALDIDAFDALGSAGLHQTQDHFVFSDNGTEKKITFSNLQDAVFADVSSQASIAAGGALSLNVAAITGQTEMTGDVADADEFVISDGGVLKRADFSVIRDAVFADVSGDAAVAAGGALTIASASVEHSMLHDNVISGQGELAQGGLLAIDEILVSDSGGVKRYGVDSLAKDSGKLVSEAAVAVANDYILFLDGGATGETKKESVADLVGFMAGTVTATGLSDSNGVLSVDINNLTGESTPADADLLAVYDADAGALRKMTRAEFIEGAALDAINIDGGAVDGITLGTNSAVSNAVMTILTASHARITNLDAVTINSVSQTEQTLEISDKLIVASLSASSANSADGGLQIGGGASTTGHASILWDHGNTALDFNIGSETQLRLVNGSLLPNANADINLGSDALEFGDIYIDGTAYLDTVDIDAGAIDGTTIGASSQSTGKFTHLSGSGRFNVYGAGEFASTLGVSGSATFKSSLSVEGNVDLGNATGDTITATGRFDSDLVPSTDSARALGTSALQWSAAHVDVGHIDQLGSALDANNQAITNVDINSGAIDGATVGAASQSTGKFTHLSASADFHVVGTGEFAGQLDVSGALNLKSNLLPVTAGGTNLGSASKELGDVYLADDKKIYFGSGQDASIEYDEDGTDQLRIAAPAAGVVIAGTAPSLTIGDADAEDAKLVFDGNAQDFYMGLDDSADKLLIGLGSAVGTTPNMTLESATRGVTFHGGIVAGGNAIADSGFSGANPAIAFDGSQNSSFKGAITGDSGYAAGDFAITTGGAISAAGDFIVGRNSANQGADLTAFGDVVGEKMFYSAANNVLQVTGSSASGLSISIGGDATSEFAIEVANGSNNNNKIKAAAFVTYSDESLKQDVTSMADSALDTVMSLEGVEFTWKDSGERDFGFIAQDVQSVLPNAVHAGNDGIHGVDYSRLTSVLVEAVKAQQVQIEDLKKVITKLKK